MRSTGCTPAHRLLREVELDVILQRAADGALFARPGHWGSEQRYSWLKTPESGPYSTPDCARAERQHTAALTEPLPDLPLALAEPAPNRARVVGRREREELAESERKAAVRVLEELGCDGGLSVPAGLLESAAAELIDHATLDWPGEGPVAVEQWLGYLEAAKARMPPNLFAALLAKAARHASQVVLASLGSGEREVAVRLFLAAAPSAADGVNRDDLEASWGEQAGPIRQALGHWLPSDRVLLEHWLGALARLKSKQPAVLCAILDCFVTRADHPTDASRQRAAELFDRLAGQAGAVSATWLRRVADQSGECFSGVAGPSLELLLKPDDQWLTSQQWAAGIEAVLTAHGQLVLDRFMAGCDASLNRVSEEQIEGVLQKRAELWRETERLTAELERVAGELEAATVDRSAVVAKLELRRRECEEAKAEVAVERRALECAEREADLARGQLTAVREKLEKERAEAQAMGEQARRALEECDQLARRRAEAEWAHGQRLGAIQAEREVMVGVLARQQAEMESEEFGAKVHVRAMAQAAEDRGAVLHWNGNGVGAVAGSAAEQLSDLQWEQAQASFTRVDTEAAYEIPLEVVQRAVQAGGLPEAVAAQWQASLAVAMAADLEDAMSFDHWIKMLSRAPDGHREHMINALDAQAPGAERRAVAEMLAAKGPTASEPPPSVASASAAMERLGMIQPSQMDDSDNTASVPAAGATGTEPDLLVATASPGEELSIDDIQTAPVPPPPRYPAMMELAEGDGREQPIGFDLSSS